MTVRAHMSVRRSPSNLTRRSPCYGSNTTVCPDRWPTPTRVAWTNELARIDTAASGCEPGPDPLPRFARPRIDRRRKPSARRVVS